MHHTLSVVVENKAGVLSRVAGLFSRRGFNIYSLAVAPTDDERFSRITIVVDVDSSRLEQITKQLFKLVNVVKIRELDPAESVERELMLCTVAAATDVRSQVIQLLQVFEGRDRQRRSRPADGVARRDATQDRRFRGSAASVWDRGVPAAPAGWRCPSWIARRRPACAQFKRGFPSHGHHFL